MGGSDFGTVCTGAFGMSIDGVWFLGIFSAGSAVEGDGSPADSTGGSGTSDLTSTEWVVSGFEVRSFGLAFGVLTGSGFRGSSAFGISAGFGFTGEAGGGRFGTVVSLAAKVSMTGLCSGSVTLRRNVSPQFRFNNTTWNPTARAAATHKRFTIRIRPPPGGKSVGARPDGYGPEPGKYRHRRQLYPRKAELLFRNSPR